MAIRARFDRREFTGKSTSHSVVEAAARAYLQAANKATYALRRLADKQAAAAASAQPELAVHRLYPSGY